MKKIKITTLQHISLMLLMSFFLVGCKPIDASNFDPNSTGKDNTSSSSSSSTAKTPKENSKTVRIMAAGDNLIHSSLYEQANARAGGNGYDFEYAYENIKGTIKKADISILNQETPISSIHKPSTYPMFNSPTELGDKVVEIGFDVFNLANNHTMDKGVDGLLSTLDFWTGKSDILTTGAYKNEDDYTNIRVKTVNDISFGFVGFTEPTNGLVMPANADAIWMLGSDEAKLENNVKSAVAVSDFVIVNVHWGNEYTHVPTERQKYLAKKLVEWGADAIMGHHPHVIQPVEYLKKPDGGKALVAYSLGNFISAQDQGPRMIGGIIDYTIVKDHDSGILSIKKAKFLPTVTHYKRGYADITVYPFSKYTNELANSHGVKSRTPNFSYDYINELVTSVIDKKFL